MFFGNMFNKFIDIALISTTKSTLKSNKTKMTFETFLFSSYLVFGFDRSASLDKSTGVFDCPA